MMEFVCNICGQLNRSPGESFDREAASCAFCNSNLRRRSLIHALSLELFGTALILPEFPRVKSIRGLGLSDADAYADQLAQKFDYRNTFYDREPRFDISNPPAADQGKYDFLIASEVFEHVLPPVELAFRQAYGLLKSQGIFILTVPYSLESTMQEHYPDLHEYGFVKIGGRTVLVNRTRAGELQVFEDLVFHGTGARKALELRIFNEAEIKRMLAEAGFSRVRICSENHEGHGIQHSESWSLPIVARKGELALSLDATRELVEAWRDTRTLAGEDLAHHAARTLRRLL